jgi:ribosomal protein L29
MTTPQLMAALLEMWPHRAETVEQVRLLTSIYGEALGDLTPVEIDRACRAALRSCRHFPVPAELIALARPHLTGKPEDDFDPLAALRRDRTDWRQPVIGSAAPLLPERAISDEQAAERRAALAKLMEQTRAQMAAASEQHKSNARIRHSRRRLAREGWVHQEES